MATAAARRTPSDKPRFRLTPPVEPEHRVQRQIANVLRQELASPGKVSIDGVVWFSIEMANYAGQIPGIRVDRGVVAGVFDTFILYLGRSYIVEIKTPLGNLAPSQQSIAAATLAAGGQVGVARDAVEFIACLDSWGIPRSHKVYE